MASRRENNEEFVAIRDEFMTLMNDVNKDAEMGVAYRDAVDELDHAYSELDRLFNKLQKEKANRAKIEKELNDLKLAYNNNVDVVGQEIERKNQEVAAIKADRDQMKEWLDRGVAECKRISDDVLQLRKDLAVSEENCAALAREKVQLTAHIKRLHNEIEKYKELEGHMLAERAEIQAHVEQKTLHLNELAAHKQEAEERENALHAEVSELSSRVNRLTECEECLADLAHKLDKVSRKIKDLNDGISTGRISDLGSGPAALALGGGGASGGGLQGGASRMAFVDDKNTAAPFIPGSNDATSAENQRGAQGGPSVADTRALLRTLQTNVENLNDYVFRFIRGKQRTFEEIQRIQQNELAALQRDKMAMLANHEIEKDALHNRCRDLEAQIVSVAMTTDAYTERAFDRLAAAARNGVPPTAAPDNAFSIGNIAAAAGLSETPPLDDDLSTLPMPPDVTDAERDRMFTELQVAFREYTMLSDTIQKLREENARIRNTASRRKIDWVKVNDSRTRYQHLVKEIEMMRAYQSRLKAENEHLEKIAAMHIEKASQTPAEAAAKKYRRGKEQQIAHIAFEEWKARNQGRAPL